MRLIEYERLRASPNAVISPDAKYYGNGQVVVGNNSRIDDGCILTGSVLIGQRVHLAPYCVLYGKAGIFIGDYSGFGAFTAMHSESDDYSGSSLFGPQVPMEFKPTLVRKPVTIGKHVLGGTRVTILPGVTLSDGISIGAHSLVKADFAGWTIIAGTPAQIIGRRLKSEYLRLLENFEEVCQLQ